MATNGREVAKQPTPLDLLSNCALEKIKTSVSHIMNHRDDDVSAYPDTTIFYTSAVTEADISANSDQYGASVHGTNTILYLDSKGNCVSTGSANGDQQYSNDVNATTTELAIMSAAPSPPLHHEVPPLSHAEGVRSNNVTVNSLTVDNRSFLTENQSQHGGGGVVHLIQCTPNSSSAGDGTTQITPTLQSMTMENSNDNSCSITMQYDVRNSVPVSTIPVTQAILQHKANEDVKPNTDFITSISPSRAPENDNVNGTCAVGDGSEPKSTNSPVTGKRSRKLTHKGQVYKARVQQNKGGGISGGGRNSSRSSSVIVKQEDTGEVWLHGGGNDVTAEVKMGSSTENQESQFVASKRTKRKKSHAATKRKRHTTYECNKCPATFTQLSLLKRHHQIQHRSEPQQSTGAADDWSAKEVTREVITDYLPQQKPVGHCLVCNEKFFNNKDLKAHSKIHSVESQVSMTLPSTEQPSTPADISMAKCKYCPNTYVRLSSLKAHMRSHRGEKPYRCTECGAQFSQSGHLLIHKRIHTGEKPYTCDICETPFKQISHLKTHVRTHTMDRPYKCDQCDSAFAQNSSLKRHKRSHTGEKPYKCTTCGMEFVVKSNLVRHSYTHTGERPYSCDTCSASFGQVIDLKRHKISHTGVKPFKCDLCDAKFSRKNNLKWHKLTHSEGASYKCDVCNVPFSTPGDLRFHKRSHEPPKPYQCKSCPSAFQQLCSLKNHELIHTSEFSNSKKGKTKVNPMEGDEKKASVKPFACDRCQARFSEKRNWKRHMILMHTDTDFKDKKIACLKTAPSTHIGCGESNKSWSSNDGPHHQGSQLKQESNESEVLQSQQQETATKGIEGCYSIAYEGGAQGLEVQAATVINNMLNTNAGTDALTAGVHQQLPVLSGLVTAIPQGNTSDGSSQYQQVVLQSLPQGGLTATNNNNCTVVNLLSATPLGVGTVLINSPPVIGISGGEAEQQSQIHYNAANSNLLSPLFISTGPDEPAKQARPAGNCLNHSAHILTMVDPSSNQLQAWCICNNSPSSSSSTVLQSSTAQVVSSSSMECMSNTSLISSAGEAILPTTLISSHQAPQQQQHHHIQTAPSSVGMISQQMTAAVNSTVPPSVAQPNTIMLVQSLPHNAAASNGVLLAAPTDQQEVGGQQCRTSMLAPGTILQASGSSW